MDIPILTHQTFQFSDFPDCSHLHHHRNFLTMQIVKQGSLPSGFTYFVPPSENLSQFTRGKARWHDRQGHRFCQW